MRNLTSAELVKEIRIGWNLGDTLDATGKRSIASETSWDNPITTKAMYDIVRASGFNTARIPVSWENHMGKAPEYIIDKNWLDRVNEVVDYAIDNGMITIFDQHHEKWHDPTYANLEITMDRLRKVWAQIAERFKGYDEKLIFESMNEPRMIGTIYEWNGGNEEGWDVINKLNEVFIETIRNSGGNNRLRHLLVPTYAASSNLNALHGFKLPANADDKVMVSVHSYTPYEFALSSGKVSAWSPSNQKDTGEIDNLMCNLDDVFISKGIPVILGEFGARDKDNLESRVLWARYYVQKARLKGIPCIWWDNGIFEGKGERFGLLDRNNLNWRYPEIIDALMSV